MTAIIPIPMLLPSPYPVTRYMQDHMTSSAVRSQTETMCSQHREVMGALKDLAKGKIAVTIRAEDVLPVVTAVLAQLDGPARDYDAALRKWNERYARVKAWQRKRQAAKEAARREQELVEFEARKEAEAQAYVAKHSRWWRRISMETARNAVEERYLWGSLAYSPLYAFGSYKDLFAPFASSRPKKPDGYEDVPALRELRDAASLSPAAVLSVPVDVVTKLQRWSS